MIRLLRSRLEARRMRAAGRLLDRHAHPEDLPDEAEAALDDEAMLEMERLWALTGAVADDPRIRAAVEQDLVRFQPAPPRRRFAPIAAALVLSVTGIGSIAWYSSSDRPSQVAATAAPSVSTAVGQRKRVTLADASTVSIDTDSEIAVRMDAKARNVMLRRGRAYFKVTKDKHRPFIVSAGDKRIRAVGTAFEVRIDKGEVIVTVVEGTVEVTERNPRRASANAARISAGTQLVTLPENDWAIRQVDAAQSTTWLSGRLSFVDEPLARAVDEMNRYSRQKLAFRDGRAPDERILGVFRAGDTLALAQAIELNGFAHIVEVTPERILVEAE
ncbi:FecR domain-containing protein [Sphingomonas psychrotolerans]|uniref:FecR domain-containing protein n=1 Tax=Sphingomonas psychrotolerans TaxID=1327635 RepID=A0ABU3N6K4_9SPHN|nr:FecR domain-containing protein [Sphingomonas psychrotolerans]MDT8759392.1 FecR domain-containing protein [Sphingomonas psychrotolerans]